MPLDAGPKIRAYYVLRHLVEAGHEVTLVCFVRPSDRDEDVHALKRYCRAVETVPLARSRLKDVRDALRSLGTQTPFLVLRDQISSMDERLRTVLASHTFDALHVDQLWMAPYASRCADVGLKVLDQHNAVFKVPQRLALGQRNPLMRRILIREASKLETFERLSFDAFDHVVWVSQDDRDAFPNTSHPGRPEHHVIPIAVDSTARTPVERPRPFRVTFLGGLHWPPNAEGVQWFASDVWPTVAAAAPDAVFTVIGKGASGALGRDTESRRIVVTGYVPDVGRYLAETAAFIVPLHTGAGMRVKILDAWSWGLPVVSTTIGAEGIAVGNGDNLLIADDHASFAECLLRVIRDRAAADRLARAGRDTVERLYDWRRVYPAWDQVYN